MLILAITSLAVEFVTKAVEEDKKHNYEEALKLYDAGVNLFLVAAKRKCLI